MDEADEDDKDDTPACVDDENKDDLLESVRRPHWSNDSLYDDDVFLSRNELNNLSSFEDSLQLLDRDDVSCSDFLLRFFLACTLKSPKEEHH